MDSQLRRLEKMCIELTSDGITDEDGGSVASLVAHGSYVEALKSSSCQDIVAAVGPCSAVDLEAHLFLAFETHLRERSSDDEELLVLSIGVAALQLFVQTNFTGPMLVPNFTEVFPNLCVAECTKDDISSAAIKSVAEHTEGVYDLISCQEYLVLAKVILARELKERLTSCLTLDWWRMRYYIIIQTIADESSYYLFTNIMKSLEATEHMAYLTNDTHLNALFHLEASQATLLYTYTADAYSHLVQAEEQLRLKYYLFAAMGKRTKFQVDSKPQLFLKVEYIDQSVLGGEEEGPKLLSTDLPKDIVLNDETRLPHIKFDDEDDGVIPNLRPIEQLALLSRVHYNRRASANDVQLKEESKAFVHALLQYPKCWVIQCYALRLRSYFESDESRAIDRALQQYEELVACVKREDPSRFERLKFFYASGLQPMWATKQEYGRLLIQLGCVKSALALFEELRLWEDVIDCYNRLGMRHTSANIVEMLLEKEETPKLWCLLGDATDKIEHYYKAFELSGEKSSRAKRCLGDYFFARKQYDAAIEHYQISTKLNYIQLKVWEKMAYSALATENWKLCVSAYKTCTNIDPHYFEYWNNMAKAHTELKEYGKAYSCFEEALRCKSDSWKMLENIMTIAISMNDFSSSLSYYRRLLELKPNHVNLLVISGLVKPLMDKTTRYTLDERYYKQLGSFLGQMCQSVPSESNLWYYYGEAVSHNPSPTVESRDLACQHFRKSLAIVTRFNTWHKNPNEVKMALSKLIRMEEAFHASLEGVAPPTALANAKSIAMMAENVMISSRKGLTNVATGEVIPDAVELLDQAESSMKAIKAVVKNLVEQCSSTSNK
ncbi:Tetratricopeptide repeat [Trinorchestia longiramus]|nr:Tetratricopeptide repeat [Trinorchestia longiramus]